MSTWVWIAISVGVAVMAIIGLRQVLAHRRTSHLRDRFGPEYERTLESADSKRTAEADLADREERRDQFDIRPLSTAARERYVASWQGTQIQFVDDPAAAGSAGRRLIESGVAERGSPVAAVR